MRDMRQTIRELQETLTVIAEIEKQKPAGAEGELEALATAFGGDIKKLRALRAALDPSQAGQS
jgi:hypothetical protein